ncbi:MAG: hypothetical protein V9G08_11500 [Dermatophilaceae bacterium]
MLDRARVADAALRAACRPVPGALTHADVDRLADLPPGTTAEEFPTEADLVDLVTNGLLAHDVGVWAAAGAALPASIEDFVARLVTFTEALEKQPEQWLAGVRLALDHGPLLEGRYDAVCDGLTVMLAALGVSQAGGRARIIMALIEGVIVHGLTVKRADPLARQTLADAFRRILS